MKTVLVTGGAGFIGSNVCNTLLKEGCAVHAVDNHITSSGSNLALLRTHPHFTFHNIDIVENNFTTTFNDISIDAIYHLACPTGVPNLTTLGEEMIRTCSLGALNVLGLAKDKSARILCASTAEIYGDPERFPQDESYTGNVDPIGMRSAYEEGKRFMEACVVLYARKYGVHAVVARIFNTYGPGMSLEDTRVIPQFLHSILKNEPLRIYGDGRQTRSHLFVDDLVEGLTTLMEKGSSGEAYNVGNNTPMTIRELAELITNLTGHSAGIEYKEHFINDHAGRCPSIEKMQALNWQPRHTIVDGLSKMIDAYNVPKRSPITTSVPVTA